MAEITITPRAMGIGAEVGGIDLGKPLPDKSFEALRSAFEAYRLLIFRNLHWTVDQQVAYSEKFGALEDFPDPKDQAEGHKTVLRVTNIDRATNTINRSTTLDTNHSPSNIGMAYRSVVSHPAVQGISAVRSGNAGGRWRHDVRGYNLGL